MNTVLKIKPFGKLFSTMTAVLLLAAALLTGCVQRPVLPTATVGMEPPAGAGSEPSASTAASPESTPTAAPPAGVGLTLRAYPSVWCPTVSSSGSIRLSAVDENGMPVKGDWTATRGAFILLPFRTPDGAISLPDQQPAKELKGMSEVGWLLPEQEQAEGGSIEIRFTRDGRPTVLIFSWDSDMGLLSIGERLVAFSADEVRVIKEFTALIKGGKPADEVTAYARDNMGLLNNGLGQVLADGVVNYLVSLRGGQAYAEIDWASMPGYGRPSGLIWDDLAIHGVKLGAEGKAAIEALSAAIGQTGGSAEPTADKTADDAGGTTRTVQWDDGTTALVRNGKLYSLESTSSAAALPNGLHPGMGLAEFMAVLGVPHESIDGTLAWGVGSNDNVIVAVEGGMVTTLNISLIE